MIEHTVIRIPFKDVPQISKTDRDYAMHPEVFSDFISHNPDLGGFAGAINARKEVVTNRSVLVSTLHQQYESIGVQSAHIDGLLESNHFTVTTAHQPSLLTGPLYYIYKICSTVNLARLLNITYPDVVVHPVFIVGGEDHDFEEINHAHFFGKTFTWDSAETGAVGRMSTSTLNNVLDSIIEVLGSSPFSDEMSALIKECFAQDITYGQAMQEFVVRLFATTELIVLQMDEPKLKALFMPIVRDELLNQSSSTLVAQSQEEIEQLGYKPQAYLREINLFYLENQMRHRIELQAGQYTVIDTDLSFSQDEILKLTNDHPERFSPNVNMRPLYQEIILPNLAYIGGGGELAYWLERKRQFEFYDIPFPVLVRRNSVLYMSKGMAKQRSKLDIPLSQLFDNPEHEISEWVRSHAEHELDISAEMTEVERALDTIVQKAKAIDPSFAQKVEAFKVRSLKEVDHIGKRLVREEKAKFEGTITKIRKFYDKLFPAGGLQERHDNFIPNYLVHGPEFFDLLIEQLNPLEAGFIVIEEV
jgi:bacillithiol synthase